MTIFLSDCHLGNRNCKADKLVKFLMAYKPHHKKIYLVGDIIDDHQLDPWPENHKDALKLLFSFENVVYLPGNHDPWVRRLGYIKLGNVHTIDETVFMAANGKNYNVLHGDRHDWLMRYTFISSRSLGHWSHKFFDPIHGHFMGLGSAYEISIIKAIKQIGSDGVICGHSHFPIITKVDGVEFMNCGDWYEHCTAIVEEDGKFELVKV